MISEKLQKINSYVKRYGIKKLSQKALEKISSFENYDEIQREENITEYEKKVQREHRFEYEPVISILVPAYNTDLKSLEETLLSVKEQTYSKWQLCICDGGTRNLLPAVEKVFENDSRVVYEKLSSNYGISGNTNEALNNAIGEYIALLDHDDILEPDALYVMVEKINEEGAEIVYTDEDKTNSDLSRFFAPYQKPDFNKTLLLSNNYMCHFTVIKRSILEAAGEFREEFDGAQDYDMFLRCIEHTDKISHAGKVVYHWRCGDDSTSDNPFNKEYAFKAGKKAIEDYFLRNGYDDIEVTELDDPGYFSALRKNADVKYDTLVLEQDTDIEEAVRKIKDDAEYVFLVRPNMSFDMDGVELLCRTAATYDADIVVPKLVKAGKYYYNGVFTAGDGYTPSLKGKPEWFKGKFNLGYVSMETCFAPKCGIFVKKEILPEVFVENKKRLTNLSGKLKGKKMVYAPRTVVEINN